MKVLLVTGSFPPDRCGVGDYSAMLCDYLNKSEGISVSVLTSSTKLQCTNGDIEVFRDMDRWALRDLPTFVRLLRRVNADIVHLQFPSQGYASGLLPWFIPLIVRLLGKKIVQTWHEPYSRRRALLLIPMAISGGGLVVVRPDYRELLHWMIRWVLWGKQYRYVRSAATIPMCTLSPEALSELKMEYLQGQKRLIVFFGFIYPHKAVHLLFEVCNPELDHIIVAGESKSSEYLNELKQVAGQARWLGKVDFTGYMDDATVSALLKVADAVVLPFQLGGGDWNTSIHAAVQSGTFVLTTSNSVSGYDESRNVYFAQPGNVVEMQTAIEKHAGQLGEVNMADHGWSRIAKEHLTLYNEVLS